MTAVRKITVVGLLPHLLLFLLPCVSSWDIHEKREIDEQKHRIQAQKNLNFITSDDPSIEHKGCTAFNSRRESISGESLSSFLEALPEDISMTYSGFEPEPTRLQAECHNSNADWVTPY
ncbi:hypothetical protein TNCV_1075461 [Trichonephila clavipes]|uniref:Uncharacterized protein n=1 Tax=Trichonephila clavipes TaxID=2585209 RepID=A0A8X6T0R8_TRICX|nr:hypothetical protein TNCV_1075461 [Trichonephila clavipes]